MGLIGSGNKMIEKIKVLYHQYADRIIQWYDGLEILYQYGVLFLIIVAGLLFCLFYFPVANHEIVSTYYLVSMTAFLWITLY